ncbi:hypothetical protein ACPA9J_33470 [Pseudomonas aeruginosa]
MTAVDLLLVATLLAALLAWWIPALPGHRGLLALASTLALGAGLYAAWDDRWQAGRRRLRRFLLLSAPALRRTPMRGLAVPDRFAVRPAGAAGNRRAVPVPGRAAAGAERPMRSACAISNWTTPAGPACSAPRPGSRGACWYAPGTRHARSPAPRRVTTISIQARRAAPRWASVKYSAFRRCSPTSSTCAPIPIHGRPAARRFRSPAGGVLQPWLQRLRRRATGPLMEELAKPRLRGLRHPAQGGDASPTRLPDNACCCPWTPGLVEHLRRPPSTAFAAGHAPRAPPVSDVSTSASTASCAHRPRPARPGQPRHQPQRAGSGLAGHLFVHDRLQAGRGPGQGRRPRWPPATPRTPANGHVLRRLTPPVPGTPSAGGHGRTGGRPPYRHAEVDGTVGRVPDGGRHLPHTSTPNTLPPHHRRGLHGRPPSCAAAVNLDGGGDFDFAPFDSDFPAPLLMLHADPRQLLPAVRHRTAGPPKKLQRLFLRTLRARRPAPGHSSPGTARFGPCRAHRQSAVHPPAATRGLLGSRHRRKSSSAPNALVLSFPSDHYLRGRANDFPQAQMARFPAWPDALRQLGGARPLAGWPSRARLALRQRIDEMKRRKTGLDLP